MVGHVVDFSGHGLAMQLPKFVPPDTPIKIEYEDELLLGEVSYCVAQGQGYRLGLVIKHRLPGLAQLHRLNRSLHETTESNSRIQDVSSIMEK